MCVVFLGVVKKGLERVLLGLLESAGKKSWKKLLGVLFGVPGKFLGSYERPIQEFRINRRITHPLNP